ncbi:hypothetical protein [Deinococcus frigens]|uniref:hypothetical protein n=1 Tax=Deinococcus frigens TaxID=249403 RepID=UPI0004974BA9|nr:hypothetical protein [Deinococcus frigens]
MTVISRSVRATLPSTICDSCLAPISFLPIPHGLAHPDALCPGCSARVALENAAAEHLHALLYPTVQAWARHWKAAGVGASALGTTLSLEGHFWHPDGLLYRREDDAHDAALAVIREALGES